MEAKLKKEAQHKLISDEAELIDQETMNVKLKAIALKKEAQINYPNIPVEDLELDPEEAAKQKLKKE